MSSEKIIIIIMHLICITSLLDVLIKNRPVKVFRDLSSSLEHIPCGSSDRPPFAFSSSPRFLDVASSSDHFFLNYKIHRLTANHF